MGTLLWRVIIPVCAAVVVVWMTVSMVQRTELEMLWGWRPFFLMTCAWLVVLSLIRGFNKHSATHRLLGLSSLSGILLSAGFPPSPLMPLMFVGLVPLFMVEESLRAQYGKAVRWRMFRYAFNAFFIWNICTTWWVINTSFLPGIVANVANSALLATVFVLIHQARSMLPVRLHWLAVVTFWIAFEYLHIHWEISWPWLTLGNALAKFPVAIQWYEYTGVFGGSFWLLLGNYWIYQWYTGERKWNRQLWRVFLLISVPLIFSVIRYVTLDVPKGGVEVAVVQPNFEPHYQKFNLSQKEQLARFLKLSRDVITDSTEYLVFPETSFGFILLNDIDNDFRIRELKRLTEEYPNLHIVTGLESYRRFDTLVDIPTLRVLPNRMGDTMYIDVQNSAVQISRDGETEVYFKSKLVPGAEFLPFRKVLPFIKPLVDMLQGSVAGLTGQEERSVFHGSAADVAPVICYESVYGGYVAGYVRNGAGMLFIVTNDGWWDDTPGHVQHLLFGALRAIEHRRPIARSANSGISCFVNIRGDILQATNYDEATAIRRNIVPGEKMTFYTRWGDLIARISVFVSLLLLGMTLSAPFRKAA